MFSNGCITVRVVMDLEPIPGTLDMRQQSIAWQFDIAKPAGMFGM